MASYYDAYDDGFADGKKAGGGGDAKAEYDKGYAAGYAAGQAAEHVSAYRTGYKEAEYALREDLAPGSGYNVMAPRSALSGEKWPWGEDRDVSWVLLNCIGS